MKNILGILPCILMITLIWSGFFNEAQAGQCFIKGTYSLNINKGPNPSWPIALNGFINSDITTTFVNWQAQFKYVVGNVAHYSVNGSYKGEWLYLELTYDGFRYDLVGTIHKQYVVWTSFGNWLNGYQPCIQ